MWLKSRVELSGEVGLNESGDQGPACPEVIVGGVAVCCVLARCSGGGDCVEGCEYSRVCNGGDSVEWAPGIGNELIDVEGPEVEGSGGGGEGGVAVMHVLATGFCTPAVIAPPCCTLPWLPLRKLLLVVAPLM